MPKVKTHSGAQKRLKLTATGKLKRKQAFKRHNLDKKSNRQKRALAPMALVHTSDMHRILKLLQK